MSLIAERDAVTKIWTLAALVVASAPAMPAVISSPVDSA